MGVLWGPRTEELLAGTVLLDDLNQTGLQLLDGGHVVREDTHLSGLGGDVDLDDALGLVDGLLRQLARFDDGRGPIDPAGALVGIWRPGTGYLALGEVVPGGGGTGSA